MAELHFAAMKTPDPSWNALMRRLKQLHYTRPDFVAAMGYKHRGIQRVQNWKLRGIPDRELLRVAKYLKCEPEPLKRGRIIETEIMGVDMDTRGNAQESDLTLSEEALDVAFGYQQLPDPLRETLRSVLDEYIASLAPTLMQLYSNVRRVDQQRASRIIEEAQKRDMRRRKVKQE